MARKFFLVSLGILALAIAYNLGAERARADWDATAPGQIIGGGMNNVNDSRWYTATGEAWTLDRHGWERGEWEARTDLPVPANQVKFLNFEGGSGGFGVHLITVDDVGWTIHTAHPTHGEWTEVGPFPGGPVTVDPQSFGKTKGSYR